MCFSGRDNVSRSLQEAPVVTGVYRFGCLHVSNALHFEERHGSLQVVLSTQENIHLDW